MKIHHWTLDCAADLAQSYNRQVADVPYCYPQSDDGFQREVQEDLQELYGFSRQHLHSEEFIVAENDGAVLGFVHVCSEDEEEDGKTNRVGVIRFLAYEPGLRLVGQALLDEAEQQFRDAGIARVHAFYKGYVYHFYSPDGGLSELYGTRQQSYEHKRVCLVRTNRQHGS